MRFEVTILCSGDKVKIQVTDGESRCQFLDLEMDAAEFTAALGRHAARPAKGVVCGLDKVGLIQENKSWEFEITPVGSFYHGRQEIARKAAKLSCPEGWTPDLAFSSQDSFFRKGEEEWARTTIRRWVPKNDPSQEPT